MIILFMVLFFIGLCLKGYSVKKQKRFIEECARKYL